MRNRAVVTAITDLAPRAGDAYAIGVAGRPSLSSRACRSGGQHRALPPAPG